MNLWQKKIKDFVPSHEETSRVVKSLYPLQAHRSLTPGGVAIGINAFSGDGFLFDPWEFYRSGIITSPVIFVAGQVGKGKSAFIKSFIISREVGDFGKQAYILDPKGEYAASGSKIGMQILKLEPGGSARLNPLDPGPQDLDIPERIAQSRSTLLSALAASGLGRELNPSERAGIDVAVENLPHDAVLSDVVELLLRPTPEMAQSLSIDVAALKRECQDIALALRRLIKGDLAGMLDGKTTVEIDWSGPGLVIDLSALYRTPAALAPTMICATSWISSAIATVGSGKFLVIDEAWAVLKDETVSWLQSTVKLSRSLGVSVVMVVHRISDLRAAGDDDSAVAKKAAGLLSDTEVRVLFGQSVQEIPLTQAVLGLSSREAQLLAEMPRGRCLWQIGRERALVDVVLTEKEKDLTDTDSAMRG